MQKGFLAVALLAILARPALAQTHAPWPADWNNWNDPALWCTVGDPGNAADTRFASPDAPYYGNGTGFGSVSYAYQIGKFEVTAEQYTAFLNAVAATDTYRLYSRSMLDNRNGCHIQRSGLSGSYTYSVTADWANRPVNYVSWGDAARFVNWLTNGRPTGAQDFLTTEDGSYLLNGAMTDEELTAVKRKTLVHGGRYYLPTEDEWYKAAYYKGGSSNAGYWDYATRSSTAPGRDMADASGNNANYSYSTVPGGPPIDSETYYTTVAGEFQNSVGPYGTFDQTGNLVEWFEVNSWDGRGGFYNSENIEAAFRDYFSPGVGNSAFGFRIAQIPEPATLSLLAVAALAVLRKRRQ